MSDSMLIYAPCYDGGSTFILSCDEAALRWLVSSLRNINAGRAFSLGDGSPIASDGECTVEVAVVPEGSTSVFRPTGAGQFEWRLPANVARRYADLVEGVADFAGACHQYLEAEQPGAPGFVISKGEYDNETLRDMRNAAVRT